MPKILIVATGIGAYANAILPTGLWLSELTHIYHRAKGLGCKITIASPKGGEIPVDPESLKPFTLDKMSKAYWNDPEFRELLHHAQSLDEVAGRRFDCVYLAGGHGSMYDSRTMPSCRQFSKRILKAAKSCRRFVTAYADC